MRLVFVSDTHLRHSFIVPEGDVLVHCGDFSMIGDARQISAFNEWLKDQPHRYKIVIAGNHDIGFEEAPEAARRLLSEPIYLQDSSIVIEDVKFYGSPWQPWFMDWAFNFPRGTVGREQARATWAKIPPQVDVLVTHGPPYGVLDRVVGSTSREHLGCRHLLARVKEVRPKIHAFGHIHSGHGTNRHGDTLFVNASICDEAYMPTLKPVVVDLLGEGAAVVQH